MHELVFLGRVMDVSVVSPSVSISVKRGERIAKVEQIELVEG
jgi:hypothetical protein